MHSNDPTFAVALVAIVAAVVVAIFQPLFAY